MKDSWLIKKTDAHSLAIALNKLSLAKNIKLMEGTLDVWGSLIADDIQNKNFQFDDFMRAINLAIRMPMYNRIDYADIYKEAKEIYSKRVQAQKNPVLDRPGQGVPMPEDVRAVLKRI